MKKIRFFAAALAAIVLCSGCSGEISGSSSQESRATDADGKIIPFSDSYKQGGYESASSPFGPSVADDLIAGKLKQLNALYAK